MSEADFPYTNNFCLTVQYCTVLYSIVQYCTVQYCTVLCSTVQYCTVLYSAVQCCTVLYSTENHIKLKIFQKIDFLRFDPMDM